MHRWIVAVYAEKDQEEAFLYRQAFEEHGFQWIEERDERALLLADAVFFLASDTLFTKEETKHILEICRKRKIVQIRAHYEKFPEELREDSEYILDAAKISFAKLQEHIDESTSIPEEKPSRKHEQRLNLFFIAMLAAALFLTGRLLIRLSPKMTEESVQEKTETETFLDDYGRGVVQVWSIGTIGSSVYRGSGFYVSDDGYILTNAHVVDHPSSMYRIVEEGSGMFEVKVVTMSKEYDLALLKAERSPAKYLSFAKTAKKDDIIRVIGYPETEGKTVSEGVYEGTGTKSDEGTEYIVLLVRLKAGNSGSPVLTLSGKVIGVATAVSAEYEQVGFMIPAETCISFLSEQIFLKE